MNTQSDYYSYIEGRSVAIVGGDDEIDRTAVNGCSVVVRINNHWQRQRGRCDVLYYSCAKDIGLSIFDDEELYSGGLEWCWLNKTHFIFGQGGNFFSAKARCADKGVKQLHYWHAPAELFHLCEPLKQLKEDERWTMNLSAKHSFHPLSGLVALEHVRQANPWKIYVTGMSLYRTPQGDLPSHAGAHSIYPQVQYLREIQKTDTRIELSPVLVDALAAATQ